MLKRDLNHKAIELNLNSVFIVIKISANLCNRDSHDIVRDGCDVVHAN